MFGPLPGGFFQVDEVVGGVEVIGHAAIFLAPIRRAPAPFVGQVQTRVLALVLAGTAVCAGAPVK